jgi:tRNA G18 (ribose-2'-O)-methylase SpoU
MIKGDVAGFFRECSNPQCTFRFPDNNTDSEIAYCPICGTLAPVSSSVSFQSVNHLISENKLRMIAFLDNIRSVYNVGSIIRTCEGLGIGEIILSGITPTPDHQRMNKTSLGAIPNLKWQYVKNGFNAASEMKSNGYQLISLESSRSALPLERVMGKDLIEPICLVVGNETLGVDPEIQKLSDLVVAIPMAGEKESFNVSVAFGIAAFYLVQLSRI